MVVVMVRMFLQSNFLQILQVKRFDVQNAVQLHSEELDRQGMRKNWKCTSYSDRVVFILLAREFISTNLVSKDCNSDSTTKSH
jgi:hypothetical protein